MAAGKHAGGTASIRGPSARPYQLGLCVYDGDQLQPGQWHEAYDRRGIRFSDRGKALAFIRERIEGTSIE